MREVSAEHNEGPTYQYPMGNPSSLMLPAPAPIKAAPFCVLVVGANVEDHAYLEINDECHKIQAALQSKFGEDRWRGLVTFKADCSADATSFMYHVMEFDPAILILSCHGEKYGLWLSNGFLQFQHIAEQT